MVTSEWGQTKLRFSKARLSRSVLVRCILNSSQVLSQYNVQFVHKCMQTSYQIRDQETTGIQHSMTNDHAVEIHTELQCLSAIGSLSESMCKLLIQSYATKGWECNGAWPKFNNTQYLPVIISIKFEISLSVNAGTLLDQSDTRNEKEFITDTQKVRLAKEVA